MFSGIISVLMWMHPFLQPRHRRNKPGRFQIQQYQGFQWRRLLVFVCGPELCWSCEPAIWTDARMWPWPVPQRQSQPTGKDTIVIQTAVCRNRRSLRLQKHTCSLVWAFCTYSRPTLILGMRMARVNSSTLMPSRWHSFWAAVLSGMDAWSWCFSFIKEMFPNWSTAEITLSMAAETERETFIRVSHVHRRVKLFIYICSPLVWSPL